MHLVSSASRRFLLLLAALAGGCVGESPTDERERIPPPGPHFSVVPLRLETIAHISPIGSNNKVFPVSHTYWHMCDVDGFGTRPCHRERQQLFAPGSGVVTDVDAQADGAIVVEGPPGLVWHFGRVTPAAQPAVTRQTLHQSDRTGWSGGLS